MEEIESFKYRKPTDIYVFRTHEIEQIKPIGNRLKETKCPAPRSGHRIVVYGGNIFAFGGYNPRNPVTNELIIPPDDRRLFRELWKFNLATKTWTHLETLGEMPSEAASHAALLIDNFMVIYGGTDYPFGSNCSNSVRLCDLDKLQWLDLEADGEVPPPLYGQAIAIQDNKIYVVGGTTGFEYRLNVHCLDLNSLEWVRLDVRKKQRYQPPARYRHEIVIYDDLIYVFGGGTVLECFDFQKIPVFSIAENLWSVLEITSTDFPENRLCHGCVQIDSDVYMFGGHNNSLIFSDIWKFDLKSSSWLKLKATLPVPLYFHSVSLSNEGQALIFGGTTDTHEDIRTNNIYSMWLKVPSLSEMCWQALTLYMPNKDQIDKKHLFELGVPKCYIDQL